MTKTEILFQEISPSKTILHFSKTDVSSIMIADQNNLHLRYNDTGKSLKTLQDILKEPFSIIIRDATIQRFKYTFEALWKFLKEYVKEKEGVVANTPKAVFRAIFSAGFLTEDETVQYLEMTDRRNETSHTYKEEVSEIIFQKVKGYAALMENLLKKFESKL